MDMFFSIPNLILMFIGSFLYMLAIDLNENHKKI
jgi:hypothetical protein